MTINMDISHITTVDEIIGFMKSTDTFSLSSLSSKSETYKWINLLLGKLPYRKLKKKQKRIVREFIQKITGYSNVQIKRLIALHKQGILIWKKWQKGSFAGIYISEDIELLHKTDDIHRLSGSATKKVLKREYEVFGKKEYQKISDISVSHIYNLRNTVNYKRLGSIFTKTKSTAVNIGRRTKPRPNGKPGYFRADTVHQGDKGRTKGVYWVNLIDEVTQFEFVFCVPSISQKYMKPVLETLIKLCPFRVIGFHSDNGSEYINRIVAIILNKIHSDQTKSRPRHCNDNALVESKNGSIVRKHFGYLYIPATDYNAHILNTFCINYFNPYLNYHRPCGYSTTITDKRGKEKKVYRAEDYETVYEKLKTIKNVQQYLKPGITFEDMDRIAYNVSDNEFGEIMNNEKVKAFSGLNMEDERSSKAI